MRYMHLLVATTVAFLIASTVSCAQSKNMTRNDTVIDEEPADGSGESIAFDDSAGLNPDELGDDGWDNEGDSDRLSAYDQREGSSDGFLVGGAGAGGAEETGNASWYGRAFHGRKTASGELFDMYELSCAHKTYPFGTVLEVTNLENGKSVRVRVNDRGPYKDGRIVDLSYAAGRDIGMLAKGTAMVKLKVVSSPGENVAAGGYSNVHDPYDDSYSYGGGAASTSSGAYSLQCGAFYSKKNADSLREKLQTMFENRVIVVKEGDLYKTRVLDIPSKSEANRFKQVLADENIPGYVIKN